MNRRGTAFREAAVGDDPEQALRYMEQLEQNIAAAFARVEQGFLRKFEVTGLNEASVIAKVGQLVLTKGTLTVTLPVATRDNAGKPVGIVSLSGTVTVNAQTAQNVNGGATTSITGQDMQVFWSLGDQWQGEG